MAGRGLLWRLFTIWYLLALIPLLLIAWYSLSHERVSFKYQVERGLRSSASMLATVAASPGGVQALVSALAVHTPASGDETEIFGPSGARMFLPSRGPAPATIDTDTSDVRRALDGDETLRSEFGADGATMILTLPLRDVSGSVIGAARLATEYESGMSRLRKHANHVLWASLIVAVLLALVTFVLAKRFVDPLNEIRWAVRRFARGDLGFRLYGSRNDEFGELRRGLNKMAAQLAERLKTVVEQRNEQESVLTGMREGVLTVDNDARLLKVNRAARDLLSLSAGEVSGKSIEEVVRVSELQRFVHDTLDQGRAREADIVLPLERELELQAYSRILADEAGIKRGALIVLNDVTRLKQLEAVRREFVANVSHELKTPITSIKGFVETLLESEITDVNEQRRFLTIISKHADRLNAIFDDLLSLSRIERNEERGEFELEPGKLGEVVRSAMQICESRAQEKEIVLRVNGDENLRARINRGLLEQAIVNLIDNAIKYSEAKKSIELTLVREGSSALINVRDFGPGIEQSHFARLFERFYRVDSARSRKQGGTGLGLSIVKHIAQAHGGEITVASTVGEGSTFTIAIPAL